jgi:hypothetical protein
LAVPMNIQRTAALICAKAPIYLRAPCYGA